MVATAATASLFPVSSPKPNSGSKTSGNLGGGPCNVDVRGLKCKDVNSGFMQVKTNAQAPADVNGSRVRVLNGVKTEDNLNSHAPRTFINQLPDWSMLLAAITTIFLAAEKQWMMLEWKTKRPDMLADLDPFGLGRIVQDGLVFRQNFSIRSYEIGADRIASIETLMNHLQETALNHVKSAGLMGDGFGSTPEMAKRNLIWVVTKMQVVVDRYPTWGDVVQVDTWVAQSGKHGMRRDWLLRDYKTGEVLTRASSNWVMMNKETRRLSKIPDEVRGEIEHYFVDAPPVVDDDGRKLPKLEDTTADYVRNGLTPRWSDLDVNQHVNNVKYIGWILEMFLSEDLQTMSVKMMWSKALRSTFLSLRGCRHNKTLFYLMSSEKQTVCSKNVCERTDIRHIKSAPQHVVEKYELSRLTLEYRRECRKDSVVKSLTSILGDGGGDVADSDYVDCQHVLQFDGGSGGPAGGEIVKGMTQWRPKYENQIRNIDYLSTGNA